LRDRRVEEGRGGVEAWPMAPFLFPPEDYGDGVDGAPTGIDLRQDALSDPSGGSRP
jgi:hypothetical protein